MNTNLPLKKKWSDAPRWATDATSLARGHNGRAVGVNAMHVRPFFHPLSSIYIFWKYYIIRRYWKVFYCIHICRVKQIFLDFIDVPLQDATVDNHVEQMLILIAILNMNFQLFISLILFLIILFS